MNENAMDLEPVQRIADWAFVGVRVPVANSRDGVISPMRLSRSHGGMDDGVGCACADLRIFLW